MTHSDTPAGSVSSHWEFREGNSDKVYSVVLEEVPGGWAVNVAYGRRGSTMSSGCKTQKGPVTYAEGMKVFAKQEVERMSKGYTRKGGGMGGYVAPASERVSTGIIPQLLNAIELEQVGVLMTDSAWCLQEKKDGRRMMLRRETTGGEMVSLNRKGQVSGHPVSVRDALAARSGSFLVDGEAMGEVIYLFDILEENGRDFRDMAYRARYALLLKFAEGLGKSVRVVATSFTAEEKRATFEALTLAKAEGVVFKRLVAPATSGRPNTGGDQLKYKFYATASFVVRALNDKRSVSVEVRDANGKAVDVGNVTIPPNHAVPAVGAIIEVRYLYAYLGGSLFQPTYLGPRDDVDASECVTAQLKYKSEEDE